MAVNKVIYGGETLIDISSDTVTADNLLSGVTAHDASGNLITGTNKGYDLGFDEGYDFGYDEGERDGVVQGSENCLAKLAPLIIQGKNLPVDSSNFGFTEGGLMYRTSLFENALVDGSVYFNSEDLFYYDVTVSSNECSVMVYNDNEYYITAFFLLACIWNGGEGSITNYHYQILYMQPNSELGFYAIDDEANSQSIIPLDWECTLIGLRYSTDDPTS